MGGVVVRKGFWIQESSCIYTVKKKAGQDGNVVLPYYQSEIVVIAKELQKEFTFTSSDNNNCKMDKLYTFESKAGNKVKD